MTVDRALVAASIATLGKLVRPIAFVWSADTAVLWIAIEVGTRLSTLGFDRGVVRAANRLEAIAVAVVIAGLAGWTIGWVLSTPVIPAYTIASVLLCTARPVWRAIAWGVIEPLAFVGGVVVGAPWIGGVIVLAIAVGSLRIERGRIAKRSFITTSLALGVADAVDVIAGRSDELLMFVLFGAHAFTVDYIVIRELFVATLGRDPIEHVLAPALARGDVTALARVRRLAVLPAIAICATELAVVPLHVSLGILAVVCIGRCTDVLTSPSFVALAITAPPALAILAASSQLVVIAGGALSGAPIGLALAAALAPTTRNLLARHFLESP
jgi:hypothetical protein